MDGDFEVDSLGGLLALATVNIGRIEGNRGAMGLMNWVGDKLLYLAHRARGNTSMTLLQFLICLRLSETHVS
jgi:hypothetical protein